MATFGLRPWIIVHENAEAIHMRTDVNPWYNIITLAWKPNDVGKLLPQNHLSSFQSYQSSHAEKINKESIKFEQG